jgi:DNA topoisomerase VI subunit B
MIFTAKVHKNQQSAKTSGMDMHHAVLFSAVFTVNYSKK